MSLQEKYIGEEKNNTQSDVFLYAATHKKNTQSGIALSISEVFIKDKDIKDKDININIEEKS